MTIRRQPSDFRVIELLDPATRARIGDARTSDRVHAVYELEKTSLTTPDAVGLLAKSLGSRAGQAGYAGLKDKHASTLQHVSLPIASAGAAKSRVEGVSWRAKFLGWMDAPIDASGIVGNRFQIVVRDLTHEAAKQMTRRRELLSGSASGDTLVVVNYFGAQRFGSARHGQGFLALPLIRGDFEQALKLAIGTPARKDSGKTREFTRGCASQWGAWVALAEQLPRCPERRAVESLANDVRGGRMPDFRAAFAALPAFTQQISVEAFQSQLWNEMARRLAERIWKEGAESATAAAMRDPTRDRYKPPAALTAEDDFGAMVFPPHALIEAKWLEVKVPLLGPNTVATAPWDVACAEVLAEHGVAMADLRIPGLRRPFFGEADRALFVQAAGFSLSSPEPDEFSKSGRVMRIAQFDLPRGAYATVVLRALGQ
ncbi:MAG: tRNA pseudouridine(13) synthase TruD [Phycisphaerales bacterium]|nr:tRNA pseudouridine(13) synthase TruD [Phycisphaerales bacterium]